jgi:cytochrome c oxidase assembly factor CtaG
VREGNREPGAGESATGTGRERPTVPVSQRHDTARAERGACRRDHGTCDHEAVKIAFAAAVATTLLAAGPVAAHGVAPSGPPDLATIALGWTFEPLVAIPLALLAVGWLAMVDRIDRAHPANPVPLVRTAAFLGGLFAIAVALMSGIERYDTTLFSVHMVQHLVLMLVAAPLIALAAPVTQILRVASPGVRQRWILPTLNSGPVAFISHPVVTWLTFTIVLWVSHFSALFNATLENDFIHDLEHVLFLGAALLFWWPVVGLDPSPHRLNHAARIGYVLLQMPFSSFLAMVVLFAGAPLYAHYATLGAPYGTSAIADQQLAAGIMWIVGDFVLIGTVLALVGAWMRDEERKAPAADRRADVERAALSERADRLALRSGRGPYGGAPEP